MNTKNTGWGFGDEAAKIAGEDADVQASIEGRQDEVELCDCGLPVDECDRLGGLGEGDYFDLTNEQGLGEFLQSLQAAAEKAQQEQNAALRLQLIQQLVQTTSVIADVTAVLTSMVDDQFGGPLNG